MRTVRETVLVEAKPESVWEVLMDPYYTPKLYPDMINITADPPGRAVVGQNRTLGGRAGRRLIEFKTQVSELVPNKLFAIKGRPGGALAPGTLSGSSVATGRGSLALIRVQPAGSRPMDARDWLRGVRPVTGEVLGPWGSGTGH